MSALDTIKAAVLGVPFDANKKPDRVGVVKAFTEMQTQLEAAQAGALVRSTLANLNALTSVPSANIMAWVVNDPTPANNGIYENTGTSGAPIWTRRASIPQFSVFGINSGGTANAIQVTTDRAFPVEDGRAQLMFEAPGNNSVSPPTIAINGGSALQIITASGGNVPVNGLATGRIYVGFLTAGGTKIQLISDYVTASIIDEVEALRDETEVFRDEAAGFATTARNNYLVVEYTANGVQTSFDLTADPGSKENVFAYFDGIYQSKNNYSLSGNNIIFTTAPADQVKVSFSFGNAVTVGTPSDGTVTTAKIADDAITYAKMQNISAQYRILGRKSSGAGDPEECTISELLDAISSTRGTILFRNATVWTALAPGTASYILQANGVGADPTWVAPPTGGSYWQLTQSAPTSCPTVSHTKVAFNTVGFSNGVTVNTGAARITPTAGIWFVSATVQLNTVVDGEEIYCEIYKNNAVYLYKSHRMKGTSTQSVSVEGTVQANGTDYFEIFIYKGGTGSLSALASGSWFQGFKVA